MTHARGWQRLLLGVLLASLAFEPRRPAVGVGPLRLTLLEALAAVLLLALAWLSRGQLRRLLRRPPPALACVTAFALAQLVSAALAPAHAALALKFAARMSVMAGCAWVVAAAWPAAGIAALRGLALGAGAVAVLAIAEGAGMRALDPFLDAFREMPFNVAGSRRASAGSEYPNLAAGFLMYGMLAAVGLAGAARAAYRLALPASLLFSLALLHTYSRGAIVATGLGLLALALAPGARTRLRRRAPLAALGVLVAASAAFASVGEIYRLRLGTEGMHAWYAAIYQPREAALVLRPRERRRTTISVTNTGLKTWVVGEAFHLSYHWYDSEQNSLEDGTRTRLPRDVAPGETIELTPELFAPRSEGDYLLVWDMVHEHASWFSSQGVTPAAVPARVSRSPSAVAPPPRTAPGGLADLSWRPGRRELWSLALGMWRERPLLGFGPDNFRWLHGPRAGRAHWDSRVFANNLYLEAAATTGSVGLAALLATLAAAGVAAWRGGAAGGPAAVAGPVLLALVAGVSAHGLVDYVFAFTGHYLLFGAVVGGCAALGRGLCRTSPPASVAVDSPLAAA